MRRTLAILTVALCAAARAQVGVPQQLQGVDIVEQLGEHVPEEGRFTDSEGRPFRLAEVLHQGKPVVLVLSYYTCPQLCSVVLSGTVRGLRDAGLTLGKDFEAVTVSIDPKDTPRVAGEKKAGHLQALGVSPTSPDWKFAVGEEPQIQALAKAVGFGYRYDPETKQFAHAAAIMVLSDTGKISRYLYGIEFPGRDMRLAIVEAGQGKVGTAFDRVLMTCFKYDPAKRRYGPYVIAFIRIGALLVFAALVILLTVLWRHDLKLKKQRGATA